MDERERHGLIAGGFLLGALVGGAVVAVMGSDQRNRVARKASRKFDELTEGRTIEDVTATIKGGARGVMRDIERANRIMDRPRQRLSESRKRHAVR